MGPVCPSYPGCGGGLGRVDTAGTGTARQAGVDGVRCVNVVCISDYEHLLCNISYFVLGSGESSILMDPGSHARCEFEHTSVYMCEGLSAWSCGCLYAHSSGVVGNPEVLGVGICKGGVPCMHICMCLCILRLDTADLIGYYPNSRNTPLKIVDVAVLCTQMHCMHSVALRR